MSFFRVAMIQRMSKEGKEANWNTNPSDGISWKQMVGGKGRALLFCARSHQMRQPVNRPGKRTVAEC